jgi:hypothetical protein
MITSWPILRSLLVAAFAAGPVLAQIAVRIETDRPKYLRYEPIMLSITVRNDSGNALIFGDTSQEDGYLSFRVRTRDGMEVHQTPSGANPVAGLVLGAGETKQLAFPLNSVCTMHREGMYHVEVQIGHARLRHDYRSNSVAIEVRDGIVEWRRTIGMPQADPTGRIPERVVSLLVMHEDQGDTYCLRMEDDGAVYATVRLGARMGGAKPSCDVDGISHVHVLYLDRPRLYVHHVFDQNLTIVQTKHYVFEQTAPRLTRDNELGRVQVVGGRLAVAGKDYFLDAADVPRGPEPAPRQPR